MYNTVEGRIVYGHIVTYAAVRDAATGRVRYRGAVAVLDPDDWAELPKVRCLLDAIWGCAR